MIQFGIVAPSNPIIGDNIEELEKAKVIVENSGFLVKYAKHVFSNTNGYSSTAKEKADDLNEMFQDKNVKMIWCAKAGFNSNTTFSYLDYALIKENPKIICGYSDITSITNMITAKTGLVTFHGTNFKTIATDKTDYSFQQVLKRFLEGSLEIGTGKEEYKSIQEGQAQGELIGGNLSLIRNMIAGKYCLDFSNKILFLEEFGLETPPALVSNYLYYMEQNEIFRQINGLWIGSYEHESNVKLEQIVKDVLGKNYNIPIIQSNHFGHIETKTVIPIGTKAKIDTNKRQKIEIIEQCVK